MYEPYEPYEADDRARHRLVRNVALSVGLAAFAISFPILNAVLPGVIAWLAGVPAYSAPEYGAAALARVLIAAVLAACVAGAAFASLARGVIFRSQRLASPAPRQPVPAGLAFALAGLGVYMVLRALVPVTTPYGRWNDDGSALVLFIVVPGVIGFLWRLMGLAAEGAAARAEARRRERAGAVLTGRTPPPL